MPYDRPTWDLTSVLYAVEGPSYFNISAPGHIVVTDEGATQFTSDDKGKQYYLTVDSIQADKIKNILWNYCLDNLSISIIKKNKTDTLNNKQEEKNFQYKFFSSCFNDLSIQEYLYSFRLPSLSHKSSSLSITPIHTDYLI